MNNVVQNVGDACTCAVITDTNSAFNSIDSQASFKLALKDHFKKDAHTHFTFTFLYMYIYILHLHFTFTFLDIDVIKF